MSEKEGRAGRMVFVTVRHETSSERGLAIEEEQDIVYVAMPKAWVAPEPVPPPADAAWREPVAVDTVLLFRFSALTFNGHRIHYDLPYATEVEKYPGLVVHGPLQAMLLMDLGQAPPARAARRRGSAFAACGRCSTSSGPSCWAGRARRAGTSCSSATVPGPRPCRPACTGRTADMVKLLQGLRVVEGTAFVAAPLAGMTLAQMGADVIRFDRIEGGLDHHRWPVTKDGQQPVLGRDEQGQALDRARPRQAARAASSPPP